MKPSARIALTLALSASLTTPAAVMTGPATAAADPTGVATAAFTQITQWPGGYLGNITVHNGTSTTMNGWRVEFNLPAHDRITSHFGGRFEQFGNRHVVTSMDWNGTLAPGRSATFGWVAAGQGAPADCTLNGSSCSGIPPDYTDPSRPGNLHFDLSDGLTLVWDPSTDDRGVVGYQVLESGMPLRTVTESRYVYSSGPTLPPKVYIFEVRAIDAAGNYSPSAFRGLGPSWADVSPASPAGLRLDVPAAGLLRLTWTPVASSPSLTSPPVAGYEVYVDGAPVGQAGRPSFTMPAPAAGAHTFAVRTFNAVDRYSDPVEIDYVVG